MPMIEAKVAPATRSTSVILERLTGDGMEVNFKKNPYENRNNKRRM